MFRNRACNVLFRGNVLADELIELGSNKGRTLCHTLQRIVVWDAAYQREIVPQTN